MTAIRNTLRVYERLKKEQQIKTLFHTGNAFSVFPIRFIYVIVNRPTGVELPVKVGFSAPKKKFKSSVHRHRIRRIMFESWRVNKSEIYSYLPSELQMHLFIVFTGTELPNYESVNKAVLNGIAILKNSDLSKPSSK